MIKELNIHCSPDSFTEVSMLLTMPFTMANDDMYPPATETNELKERIEKVIFDFSKEKGWF